MTQQENQFPPVGPQSPPLYTPAPAPQQPPFTAPVQPQQQVPFTAPVQVAIVTPPGPPQTEAERLAALARQQAQYEAAKYQAQQDAAAAAAVAAGDTTKAAGATFTKEEQLKFRISSMVSGKHPTARDIEVTKLTNVATSLYIAEVSLTPTGSQRQNIVTLCFDDGTKTFIFVGN